MSTMPDVRVPDDASRLPMTLPRLAEKKALGEPIVMVTAYDYPSALAVDAAGVDLVLVGDSGAMTVLGHASTVPVELDELLMLAKAVRRGLTTPLLVDTCWDALPVGGRLVANAVTVESEAVLAQWHARVGGELVRVEVQRAEPVGGFTGWKPAMPVTIWSVTRW